MKKIILKKIPALLGIVLLMGIANPIWAQDYEKRLKDMGIKLIKPAKPIANYVKATRSGNLVFLAGHGPQKADGSSVKGRVGESLSLEAGKEAARLAAISLLSSLKAEIGSLNKVNRILKVRGMVNCTADFYDQPKVINGCSDLLVELFGENGKHARAAVGMVSLPSNIAVEIEMIVELKE